MADKFFVEDTEGGFSTITVEGEKAALTFAQGSVATLERVGDDYVYVYKKTKLKIPSSVFYDLPILINALHYSEGNLFSPVRLYKSAPVAALFTEENSDV